MKTQLTAMKNRSGIRSKGKESKIPDTLETPDGKIIEARNGLPPKMTTEKVRKFARLHLRASCDPELIANDLLKHFEGLYSDNPVTVKKALKALTKNWDKVSVVASLENHSLLAEAFSERLRPLVIDTARQIESEYNCESASEKMLAEVVAGAYGRVIEYSREFNGSFRNKYLSNEKNQFYGIFSKEVDRAHRQLFSALVMLKQIKTPAIELNVRAKTAFVAQNQQFNATTQDETINPK